MNLEEFYQPVRRELEVVEERLLELSQCDNGIVSSVVAGLVKAGGKRVRPALLLIGARACGYEGERGIRLAVAVELVHTASLIHDDVIDDADVRRGIPTVSSRWGNKVSVLVGDHLYTKMMSILAEDGDLEVIRRITAATARMTDGEMQQTLCRGDMKVTEGTYLSIIASKTASLMSCSCRVGAMLGKSSNGEADALARYGLNLGMAFQITDDLLDLIGREDAARKTLKTDITEGKMTLPVIHAMGVAGKSEREWMEGVLSSQNRDIPERMMELVKRHGGIEYSLERARDYARACREEIASLRRSEYRDSLSRIPDCIVERAS